MAIPPRRPGPIFKVELTLDGRRQTLKPFIHDVISGSIVGMIGALKGGDDPDLIEIRLVRREGRPGDAPAS